jgi:hypothetical protein
MESQRSPGKVHLEKGSKLFQGSLHSACGRYLADARNLILTHDVKSINCHTCLKVIESEKRKAKPRK